MPRTAVAWFTAITEVIAVRLNDHPNALYEIPKTLGDNGYNIQYFYSTLVKDESMLILRVEDTIIELAFSLAVTLRTFLQTLLETDDFGYLSLREGLKRLSSGTMR